ncbi:MAG: hypothetical protein GY861_13970 [bacterium]|nr:hypothetical protein [bacterium]
MAKKTTTEIIREVIPTGMSLQIQTLSNEIFDINEEYDVLSIKNHNLSQDIKDKDKYIAKLEREVIDLNRQIKRYQSDFNQAEKRYFSAKKDIEFLRDIKIG